jgi:radical SAM superfamily enzyme YgiQ (UPF0313 family)
MGKTILLIAGNTETVPAPVYPLALSKLAGAAAVAGHTAVQFDALSQGIERLSQVLQATAPDIIGLSIRNIDNTNCEDPTCYLDGYQMLATRIREFAPAVPLVLGGSGFSLFPEPLARLLNADLGVVGDGQRILASLLNGDLEHYPSDGPRLIFANEYEETHKPAPMHEHRIIDYYWRYGGMIGLQTKRGCPKSCSYCTYPLIEGRTARWNAPEEVADEIERLIIDHGVSYFYFTDSVFNLSAEREIMLAEEICRRSLPISWGAFFAPRGIERDYLATLKRSGLTHVEMGTDSLSDSMLQSYHKDFDVAEAVRSSSLCVQAGLHCAHYLIFGGPGETLETIRETIDNARLLSNSLFFPFAGVRIYPGTRMFSVAVQEGAIEREQDCLRPVFYFSPALKDKQLRKLIETQAKRSGNWVFSSSYKKFAPVLRRLRERGVKGPLWERLIA